jgi:exosortase/archaeosortase family protein
VTIQSFNTKILLWLKEHSNLILKILPLLSFVVPFLWLYLLEPGTFEAMWKGRTFQLFFIWLIALELIMDVKSHQFSKLSKVYSAKTILFTITLTLPAIYVAAANYWGLNQIITNWAVQNNFQWGSSMPLSTEYLVFGTLFCILVFLSFGFKGLKTFSVPAFFILLVGAIYTIDNIFPYGQFTPFQILVPTTTTLAASILNLMGYTTSINYIQNSLQGTMPVLTSTDPTNPAASATFSIAWPCAGIESFLIFTVVILLFLKRMPVSWKNKMSFFVFGAGITYLINSLRIVNIFLVGMSGGDTNLIHLYYGPLYAITWIITYPLLIMASQTLWSKLKRSKPASTESRQFSPNLA